MSKVAVLGAGGGIGQPLSLLMKLNPRVSELALYDIKGAPGQLGRGEEEEEQLLTYIRCRCRCQPHQHPEHRQGLRRRR